MSNSLPSTSELIKKYSLNAKRSLGQNFIIDKNFTDKIVRSAGNLKGITVLEIGPGPGSLTCSILNAGAKKLITVEKDFRCLQALKEIKKFYGECLEIIEDDAIKINETSLLFKHQTDSDNTSLSPSLNHQINSNNKFKIIANLPYNIGTVLIFKWLKIAKMISSMTLMLQKEVVERIIAKPGNKNYGRLAVMINFLCETKMIFEVNKSIFTPQPKVTSAIIKITPREKPLFNAEFKKLEYVTSTAFNQRRKMLRSSLKPIFPNPEEVLKKIDINPQLRAENITIEEFCKITSLL